MNGGQDTGGGFGSFGTSNQGFSGNLNLQGGGLNSSTQSFAQQPITSGGGDIVLTPSGEKKKRWPIVVLVFLVLAIVGVGIAMLFMSRNFSNNRVSEDSYKKAISILVSQEIEMESLWNELSVWREDKSAVVNVFRNGELKAINQRIELLENFDIAVANLKEIGFSGEVKEQINNAISDLEGYKKVASDILGNLRNIYSAFLSSDYDELEKIADDNDFTLSLKDLLLGHAREYAKVKFVIEACESNWNNCDVDVFNKYQRETAKDVELTEVIFETMINEEKLNLMKEYEEGVESIRVMLGEQEILYYGGDGEEG